MSTPWNQPPTNHNNSERKNVPFTGGLLSNHMRQVQSGNQMGQAGQQSQPPQPSSGGPRQSLSTNPPSMSGRGPSEPAWPSAQGQGMLSNTINMMRRWSGKMATVAGYAPQPPAPYMERYHVPGQLESESDIPKPSSRPWKRSRTLRVTTHIRQRRSRWQRSHPSGRKIWLSVLLSFVALLVILAASGGFYGYDYYQNQLPRVQALAQNAIPQTSRIYDRHGKLLGGVETDHPSVPVTYNDIPQVMQNAMIAAEDPTFWDNNGVDPQGILRAGTQYLSAGGKVQSGGSTITQQVIKNLAAINDTHATDETFQRKIQEAAGAIGLTSQYSKAQILTMYFNVSPFSNSTRGIEAAVENYFNLLPKNQDFSNGQFKLTLGITRLDIDPQTGKSNPLLGLARASMLASIPQNPTEYDPTLGAAYKDRLLARQDYVLNAMMANNIEAPGLGPVTPDIIKQAKDIIRNTQFTAQPPQTLAPHFVNWVIDQLAMSLGNGDYNAGATILQNGGFNIRTTLDASLEQYAENSITRHLRQPEYQWFLNSYLPLSTGYNVNDSSAVVINAHTGEILAMVGSAQYDSTDPRVGGQANAAAGGSGTQEGSSFKPFAYATAFQMGWYPGLILPDNATYVPNGTSVGGPLSGDYHPPDFGKPDGSGKADTTVRYATDVSWNIPAVKAGAYVGSDILMTNLKRMGLNHVTGPLVASSPLGTSNATVLEMTGAYQTFANAGTHIPPQPILDIWDNYGHNLYHYDTSKPPTVPVFSPEVAYLMTSVLIDQPTRHAEFLNDPDLSFAVPFSDCYSSPECSRQLAAKTGTTDKTVNGIDRVADNWTMGYTPDIAVGVWSGNANGAPLGNVVGVTGAAPIWKSLVATASGFCSLMPADPDLPCPPDVSPQSLGIDTAIVFPKPNDVHQVSLNTYNGLAGSGNFDYVIGGMEPSSGGMPPQSGGTNPNDNNGQGGPGKGRNH